MARPKLTDETRRQALSVRLLPDLYAKLVQAGEASGRSLSQEIEERLRLSMEFEAERKRLYEALGGAENAAVFQLIAELIKAVEASVFGEGPGTWLSDPWTQTQVVHGIKALLEKLQPPGAAKPPQGTGYRRDYLDIMGETTALNLWRQRVETDAKHPLHRKRKGSA